MKQPYAKVSINDIERIIRRDYGSSNYDAILGKLKQFEHMSSTYRVWAAILKTANGNFDKLDDQIKVALADFRDILSDAEYPEYSMKVGFNSRNFNEKELKEIIDRDWQQYQLWLNA